MKQFRLRALMVSVILAVISTVNLFGQKSKEFVIQCGWDSESFSHLDASSKSSGIIAYNQLIQGLTKEPQIRIRQEKSDMEMRELQKKSQKDADIGLASDDSAYALDKGSRANLALRFSMSKLGGNFWKLSVNIIDPESMNLITGESSDRLELSSVTDDVITDKLAYDVLMALQTRNYIKPISIDVTNQLLHEKNSDETLKKYIDSYTKQIAEADADLRKIQSEKMTGEERLAAEAQERALKLKKEMAEKNRLQAEENMRRQKQESELAAKKEAELEKLSATQRNQVLQYAMSLTEKQNEIRKKTLSTISLKKRIELIEANRFALYEFKSQIEDAVTASNMQLYKKMAEEQNAKLNEPWRIADLSNGLPTEAAKQRQSKEVEAIRLKYEKIRAESEKELRASADPIIRDYNNQIVNDIVAMEKETYEFVSLNSDGLSLSVGEFNGMDTSWPVTASFNPEVPRQDLSKIDLPDVKIPYEMMTGKKVPKKMEGKEYDDYLDMVDLADRYFRISVPYLYSHLVVKVKFDGATNSYVFTQVLYEIYITENNKLAIYEKVGGIKTSATSARKLTGKFVKTPEEKAAIFRKTGRQGFHGFAGFASGGTDGASFKGMDFSVEAYLPIHKKFRNVYYGVDAGFLKAGIDWEKKVTFRDVDYYLCNGDLYKVSGAKDSIGVFSADAVIGATKTFAKFVSPYVQLGMGGVFGDITGVGFEVCAGCDFRIWKIVVGPEAKFKSINGLNLFEVGVSGGFVW